MMHEQRIHGYPPPTHGHLPHGRLAGPSGINKTNTNKHVHDLGLCALLTLAIFCKMVSVFLGLTLHDVGNGALSHGLALALATLYRSHNKKTNKYIYTGASKGEFNHGWASWSEALVLEPMT